MRTLNKWLLSSIKAQAEQIEIINPDGAAFQGLKEFMADCTKSDLETIVAQDIKWFSNIARNRMAELQ